jgi:alpha-L-fucosidase 2
MVLGEPQEQRIALNHQRSGAQRNAIAKSRRRRTNCRDPPSLLRGKIVEASHRANSDLGAYSETGVDPYQPFGDLWLHFPGHDKATDYRRELDLSTVSSRPPTASMACATRMKSSSHALMTSWCFVSQQTNPAR